MSDSRQPPAIVNLQVPAPAHVLLKNLAKRGLVSIKLVSLAAALAFEELGGEDQVRLLNRARATLLSAQD